MNMTREAVPGAMKLPAGAMQRERIEQLEARVSRLEAGGSPTGDRPELIEALIARIAALEARPSRRGGKQP